jgi:hypothetical protein
MHLPFATQNRTLPKNLEALGKLLIPYIPFLVRFFKGQIHEFIVGLVLYPE